MFRTNWCKSYRHRRSAHLQPAPTVGSHAIAAHACTSLDSVLRDAFVRSPRVRSSRSRVAEKGARDPGFLSKLGLIDTPGRCALQQTALKTDQRTGQGSPSPTTTTKDIPDRWPTNSFTTAEAIPYLPLPGSLPSPHSSQDVGFQHEEELPRPCSFSTTNYLGTYPGTKQPAAEPIPAVFEPFSSSTTRQDECQEPPRHVREQNSGKPARPGAITWCVFECK